MSQLLTLMERQKQLLQEFLQLGKEQTGLIAKENTEAFLNNLAGRQKILDEIETFREELAGLLPKQQDTDPRVAALREEIRSLLLDSQAMDQKNSRAAEEKITFFQAEIRRVSDTRKSVELYSQGDIYYDDGYDAGFIDKRS